MSQATFDVPVSHQVGSDAQLYRHVKRPEWGLALLVRERDNTRTYQFEDGRRRKIRQGYYKLMTEADGLGERAEPVRENLRRVVEAGADDSDQKVVDAVCPFSEQVALFTRLYPKGFEDPEWVRDHRRPEGAPLKRHRGPIVAQARETLDAERCEKAVAADRHEALLDDIAALLARTDLVPVAHAKALLGLESDEKRRYVESVADLLHADRPWERRFKDHLRMLRELFGERPSWRVATVLAGIHDPQQHVVVRRSAFLRQAGSVAPTARYTRRARVGAYQNFRRVAVGVRERLNAAGHEPRDLLDVYDFIWSTLRTSALDHLGADR